MRYVGSFLLASAGCISSEIPRTFGDTEPMHSFGYHPLDPLPVEVVPSDERNNNALILNSLPDETMRLAIGEIERNGNVTYGPARIGVAGKNYVVILDYIKFTTSPKLVSVTIMKDLKKLQIEALEELKLAPWDSLDVKIIKKEPGEKEEVDAIVPTYIGVGLRLTANVTVNEGSIDLGNLLILGAAAAGKQISGTLVIQTLGISGENISNLIPMPSEINPSTIQNAILALGAIKTKV